VNQATLGNSGEGGFGSDLLIARVSTSRTSDHCGNIGKKLTQTCGFTLDLDGIVLRYDISSKSSTS